MLGLDQIIILAVLLGAMILFITGKLRVDLVALCVLAILLISGILKPGQALYGFANPATATVAAMFVLSAGLARTGFVDWLARSIAWRRQISTFVLQQHRPCAFVHRSWQ